MNSSKLLWNEITCRTKSRSDLSPTRAYTWQYQRYRDLSTSLTLFLNHKWGGEMPLQSGGWALLWVHVLQNRAWLTRVGYETSYRSAWVCRQHLPLSSSAVMFTVKWGVSMFPSSKTKSSQSPLTPLCRDFSVTHHVSCTCLFISFHAGTNKSTFLLEQLQGSLPAVFHQTIKLSSSPSLSSIST